MSRSYENTYLRLNDAMLKEQELLAALYSPQTCRTRVQLQQLMDIELGELIKIKKQIKRMSKDAILEGMRQDGVEYPLVLWTEKMGTSIPDFELDSLNQQAPVVTAPAQSGKLADTKNAGSRTVIYAVTATGVVLTITGLTMSPVNLLLLSMGIVLTATGLVLLVKEVYFDKKSLNERKPAVTPAANAEAAQIADLLKAILDQNCEVIRKWNSKLYKLAAEVMDKAEGSL